MSNKWIFLIVLVIAGVSGGYYYLNNRMKSAEPPATQDPMTPLVSASPKDQTPILYPVSEGKSAPLPGKASSVPSSLPSVDESDQSIQEALLGLFEKRQLESLVYLKDLIRRFVITVDNATGRHSIPGDSFFLLPVPGRFQVKKKGTDLTMSPNNYKRYDPYIGLIEGVDLKKLVSVYRRFYPLFQSAYLDLNPHGYFNDRLIEVIDSIIATPEVKYPVDLTLDSVYYKYSNFELENSNYAQKLLIRTGPDHTKILKAKLRQLRELLSHLS